MFQRAIQGYVSALKKHPIPTQVASSGVLWAVGDAVAQRIEGHPFQWKRLLFVSSYGALFNGTAGHLWYLKLDQVARRFAVAGSPRFVFGKVLADTAIFGPVHVSAFFTCLTLVEGGGVADVKKKLRRDLLPTLAAEATVWPAVQTFNFWKVPVQYQLLLVNTVTIADAAFMSFMQHGSSSWFYRLLPSLAPREGVEKAGGAGGGKDG